MKKLAIALAFALGSIACDPIKPMQSMNTANPQVTAEVVTKFDGVVLYHFVGGNPGIDIYVARVVGTSSISASWDRSCGDDCTETVRVQTVSQK